MADHVEVKPSTIASAGRGLFAKKKFAAGEVVCSVDRPLIAEVDGEIDRFDDTCAWCFRRGLKDPQERAQAASMGLPMGFTEVKSCTGCQRVAYCSKKCQSKAWKTDHKYECKIIGVKDRPMLPAPVRAVIKLLGRLQADPDGDRSKLLELITFKPFEGGKGLSDFEFHNKSRFDDFKMLANAAWIYCGKPEFSFAQGELIAQGFLYAFYCNQIRLSSPLDEGQYGNSFDPLICSANHSCEPNVVLTFDQPRQSMRALKTIKTGDEIFINYIDVTNPFGIRQVDLKEGYYFSCQCPKCKKGSKFTEDAFRMTAEDMREDYHSIADELVKKHEDNLSRYMVPANDMTAQNRLAAMQAEAFTVSKSDSLDVEQVQKALKLCLNSDMWPWTRQPVPKLCRTLFSMYLNAGEIYRAFRVALKYLFEILPVLYKQPFYPERLIFTWTLSTIVNVLCGPQHEEVFNEMAKEAGIELRVVYVGLLLELHDNMPLMYGWDTPFGAVVKNTYDQIMQGIPYEESELREKAKVQWPKLETLGRSVSVDTI